MTKPWQGFWQVLYDEGAPEIVQHGYTTTALRAAAGFSVYTARYVMHIRVDGRRDVAAAWPPTREETIAWLKPFRACTSACEWGGTTGSETVMVASDPRIEGTTETIRADFDDDLAHVEGTVAGVAVREDWRRLSGPGRSALDGAWEGFDGTERWLYLATAGHYGVMRANPDRQREPADGTHFTDDELFQRSIDFGANAGARLETKTTLDAWPMLAQVAGYDVNKHPTFRLDLLEEDRTNMSMPPIFETGSDWHRLD